PSARDLGMTVTNTPDVLSECTADLAITLLLMVARRAGEGERELRAGKGAVSLDGRLIDYASIRQAEVLVEKAGQIAAA
ncbi:hypothetical protein ACOQFT_01450, partial [Ruegeria sp. MALMAid1280]